MTMCNEIYYLPCISLLVFLFQTERVKAYHSAKDDVFKWESVIIANSRVGTI